MVGCELNWNDPNIYNDMPFNVIIPTTLLLILSVQLNLSFLPCFPFKKKVKVLCYPNQIQFRSLNLGKFS